MGIQLLELLYFAISSPTEIAVSGFAQIRIREVVELSCRIKARGNLVGNRLVVDETVRVRGADSFFIEAHGIEVAAFYSCDFRTHERRAVFEILRAVLGPYFEMLMVSYQSFRMKLYVVGVC